MVQSCFGGSLDKRLVNRHSILVRNMFSDSSTSILSISKTRSDQIGSYRFLRNKSVTEDILITEMQHRCSNAVKGKTVLCLHDSSEANFRNHRNRIAPDDPLLGYLDDSKGLGFKMHLSVAIDAKSCFPYGVSNLFLWKRDREEASKQQKEADTEPKVVSKTIESNESNKWDLGCKKSNEVLSAADRIIHVQDREGDIYDQIVNFGTSPKEFYIIRSRWDRQTEGDEKLWDAVSESEVIGSYNLFISGDSHSKRKPRTAKMEIRVRKVNIKRPDNCDDKKLPLYTTVTMVETKEIDAPAGVTPLLWRLLTDCAVSTLEDALQIIEWYECRWYIEELFRVVKKENLNIEGSELESGKGLRNLGILAIDTAVKLFQYYIVSNIEEGETLESISSFNENELSCLTQINTTLEGKTEKQKNPYNPKTIHWTRWILARLGGWKGYKSQRKAGMTTIIKGIERFYLIYEGFMIGKDVCTR